MKFTSTSLTIVSFNAMTAFNFNTFHGFLSSVNVFKRLPIIGQILSKQNADLITLQEVHTYYALNKIKEFLPNHKYIVFKKYIVGPRGGLVTFSKYPLKNINYHNFTKRGKLTNSSFIAHVIKNGVLSCEIEGSDIAILNTHMTPNLDFNWQETSRFYHFLESQLKQISTIINEIASSNKCIIVAGDFNTSKNSALYKKFIDKTGVVDVFAKYNTPTLHEEYLSKKTKTEIIDYIFYYDKKNKMKNISQNYLFTEKELLGNNKYRYLSDHIGLKVKFSL